MRPLLSFFAAAATLTGATLAAGAAHAEHVCTSQAPDSAVSVSIHVADDGRVQDGEVHWAVPNVRPDLPSMVHIVYPLEGDHAGARPMSVITLNAVTGQEIVRSPRASVQIVIDGMEMAVRAWDLYGRAVEQLQQNPPAGGLERASFVGAVPFTASFPDGARDTDSLAALTHLGRGARTLQVRLLGDDGMALQDHTYRLFDMAAPSDQDVRTALAADLRKASDLSACQAY